MNTVEPEIVDNKPTLRNDEQPARSIVEMFNNADSFNLSVKTGSTMQTFQGTKLPSGYTTTQTIIDNDSGKKATLAHDIVELVDKKNLTIKAAADLTGMSQQYAGKLYHEAGGKKVKRVKSSKIDKEGD